MGEVFRVRVEAFLFNIANPGLTFTDECSEGSLGEVVLFSNLSDSVTREGVQLRGFRGGPRFFRRGRLRGFRVPLWGQEEVEQAGIQQAIPLVSGSLIGQALVLAAIISPEFECGLSIIGDIGEFSPEGLNIRGIGNGVKNGFEAVIVEGFEVAFESPK